MINTSIFLEKFLQNYRFRMVKPYLKGDVLDFGGNEGELGQFVKGKYLIVNYDNSVMENTHNDTIAVLAVVEHIEYNEVFEIFKKFKNILNPDGRIFLTTPTKISKPLLEFFALVGILGKENIEEHKHYWSRTELYKLAEESGFEVEKFRWFQLGLNQYAVFKHKK
jgi:2-polyprenyl-3-methyl-5-hydroxy-6-metoxy-1,4-benzoquinol methylase